MIPSEQPIECLMRTRNRGTYGKAARLASACLSYVAATVVTNAQYPSAPQIAKDGTVVSVEDYASLPLSSTTTGSYPPSINFGSYLARVNFLRSEPAGSPLSSTRFFVNDQNRYFYILDKTTREFTPYMNFEEIFPKFVNTPGYSAGLITFAFDPDYATNGRFYTVHTENPSKTGSAVPTNTGLPGLDVSGYTVTATFDPPAGAVLRETVLVEWTDTNINDATFQGSARELLRVGFNSNIHPMGDLIFNPVAEPGDPDYRNLYIAVGDGASGESPDDRHPTPQRLDALQGKILRITPDPTLRADTSTLGSNGRYRIPTSGPDPNPFVSLDLTNLKKEIHAYGFRNPHRMSWDKPSNRLIVDDIGLNSWEEIDIIHAGGNYGYAEREGNEQLFISGDPASNGKTGSQLGVSFPDPDELVVSGLAAPVTPVYPVAQYSHQDGDAICSGFVYRGSLMFERMNGRYLFGDVTTARLFYSDLAAMLAADDGDRSTLAEIHELQVVHNGVKRRLYDVLSDMYHAKGGTSSNALPGGCGGLAPGGNDPEGIPYGCGRADIRLACGGDGEIYLLSKSDGMIRKLTGILVPPTIVDSGLTNGVFTLTWTAIADETYRVQYSTDLKNWTDLPGDVTATGPTASKSDISGDPKRFYRVNAL